MKIKTGDNVRIMTGKDKGKEGKVLQVFPKHNRLIVDGANIMKRHLRSQSGTPGQKIEFPAPLHVSNVQIVSKKNGAPGRVGYKVIKSDSGTKKIRVLRSRGETEDIE